MHEPADVSSRHNRRIGKFSFTVEAVPPESADRSHDRHQLDRSDALARWLLAEWEREQRRHLAERN